MNVVNGPRTGHAYRIVGVIHLPPLPGSARGLSAREMTGILETARRDAAAWTVGGADALIVENFGDVPFNKGRVGAETIAAMTLAVSAVVSETGLPVGVNVLRNDVEGAVAEGRADAVQMLIRRLDASLTVWADVDVKHASRLSPRLIGELAEVAVTRGLAGAVIVTGAGTGQPTDFDDLRSVRAAVPGTPVYVGSGTTVETLSSLLSLADGAIIGTAAKADGIVTNPVDLQRVRALVAASSEVNGP